MWAYAHDRDWPPSFQIAAIQHRIVFADDEGTLLLRKEASSPQQAGTAKYHHHHTLHVLSRCLFTLLLFGLVS